MVFSLMVLIDYPTRLKIAAKGCIGFVFIDKKCGLKDQEDVNFFRGVFFAADS